MVYSSGLENHQSCKGFESSNLSPSAIEKTRQLVVFFLLSGNLSLFLVQFFESACVFMRPTQIKNVAISVFYLRGGITE